MLADCEIPCSSSDSFHISSAPPIQPFPLPFLSSISFLISLHLPSVHTFPLFFYLFLLIPVRQPGPVLISLHFPASHFFSFIPLPTASYCPLLISRSKQCYDLTAAISSIVSNYLASFRFFVLIISCYQLPDITNIPDFIIFLSFIRKRRRGGMRIFIFVLFSSSEAQKVLPWPFAMCKKGIEALP